jgi:hypothetical protein
MNKLNSILIFALLILLIGCADEGKDDVQTNIDKQLKENIGLTESEIIEQASKINIAKKYPIKSGVITFNCNGIMEGQKVIVYFDDYGTKERNELYTEDASIFEIRFTDGEFMYKLSRPDETEKTAYIMGPGKYGTEMKFDPDPFRNDDKRKEKYQFKKLPNINIVGRDCEVYSSTIKMGTTTFGGWNGIHLYSKVEFSMGISETVAIDFKENEPVDAGLFKVPPGYTALKI